ncbi:MAG: hypothetical protein ACM3Q0_01685 [Bacteroidota bacterium]
MWTYLRRLRQRRRITGAGEGAPPACDGAGAARLAVADVASGESEEGAAARPLTRPKPATRRRLAFRRIPILINSFNRLQCLRSLVDWLEDAGYAKIIIIDNASSFPPLLSYLERLERKGRATVVRLGANVGHLAIWRQGLLQRLGINLEYVYTDPDIVPAEFCPGDVLGRFREILDEEADIATVGFGLRLDDIPDHATHKAQVLSWESRFWLTPAAPGLFLAPIDTTFALYRPFGGHSLGQPSLRTGWPYLASHVGWLIDHDHPTEEDVFYFRSVRPDTSHWSVPRLPAWLDEAQQADRLSRPIVVHFNDAEGSLPGYIEIRERGDRAEADGWLRAAARLAEDSVDGFYCEDDRCRFLVEPGLLETLYRAAKQNALLVLRLPARAVGMLELEQPYLFPAATGPGGLSRCEWMIERLLFVVDARPSTPGPGASESLVRRDPTMVREVILHLRATKPPRPTPMLKKAECTVSRLDRWPGFAKVSPADRPPE